MAHSCMTSKYDNGSAFAWKEPRCLIESGQDHKLGINQETLSMLQKITDPVVVVGIVGLYRTGKSYLMNRLAGQPHGFDLGSTVQSKTKGIWVWCGPHPSRKNCCMVLLDTEGLGDVEKGNVNHDIWIFALTVLLSSTMVYNSIGTIAQQALNDIHFVSEMTKHIEIKSTGNEEESEDFDRFFPSFIWAVRDFNLDLEIDGKPVTEDEYLDHALKLKRGTGRSVVEYNLPRDCIRTFFPQRKCFVFSRPVEDQAMLRTLESVADTQLNPKFLQQIKAFLQYVFESGRMKTVNGKSINGRLLGGLACCYVDAIRNGAVPCIESAVETTAMVENERAIKEALEMYRKKFRWSIKFPTETMLELSNCHHDCEKDTAENFMKVAIFDSEKIFYQRMMEEITVAYQDLMAENETLSRQTCDSLLSSLHQTIENDFRAGKYARPGGYESYRTDMDSLVQRYRQTPGKGVMSEEVLRAFMKQQEATSASALRADKQLVEEARKCEEEKQKAEASERQRLIAEEELRKKEQLMVDQKKSFDEHVERLERQADEDRKKIQEEYEQVLTKRMAEQERLLKEGFERRASEMNSEIDGLKKSIVGLAQKNSSVDMFDMVDMFLKIIPPIFKVIENLSASDE